MSNVIALAGDDDGFEEQPKPKFELVRGVDFVMPYGGTYEGYRQVLRKDEITQKQLAEMYDQDGQAKALFRLITLPIRSAVKNATIVPADDGEEEADFITQMFMLPPNAGGMTIPFERVMAQMLRSVFHGFSPFEQVYWSPTKGPLKGKITLKKLAYRPPETITFLVDDDGKWRGLRQKASINGKLKDVFIPRDDAFYIASNEEDKNFYGTSYFKSAYYQFDKKTQIEYMMYLAAQRSAVGFRIGKYDGNPSKGEKFDFAVMLENMSFAQAAMVPKNWEIDSLKEGGSFDFLAAISLLNSQMSKSVLADFLDQNQGTSANTTPMVDFSQRTNEFFVLMLRTIMGDIAAAINHYIIPKFIDWNFDSGKYPRFQWGSFTDEQLEAIRYLFMELSVAGDNVNASPETIRALEKKIVSMYSLDVNWDAVETREAEEKVQADKLAQQQAQGQINPQFSDVNNQNNNGNNRPPNRPGNRPNNNKQ